MLFNSLQFPVFFAIVVCLYFALSPQYRWVLLLAASYYFYMCWKPYYIVLLLASTLIDYFAAKKMAGLADQGQRKKYLWLSIVANLMILFSFKYAQFALDSLRQLFAITAFDSFLVLDIILPIGISFYTFQSLSYTVDVYRGTREAERHLGIFALYVAFFPQLVAGPIERSDRLLPQFRQTHEFDYQRVVSGLQRMLWGFFKKLVIADRLAVFVDQIYAAPGEYSGLPLIVATYAFAIQIYCDFSGYCDIAIGAARIMGYNLVENFRQPYFSSSVSEFWKRWHVSLSSWFKDYVYIPLGGNRVVAWRWHYNLAVVFLLSGLWHGANWTFVVWGALHGLFVVAEKVWPKRTPAPSRVQQFIRAIVTFHLVCFAWIFFRAASIADAWHIATHLWSRDGSASLLVRGMDLYQWSVAVTAVMVLLVVDALHSYGSVQPRLVRLPLVARWALYYSVLFAIILFGKFAGQQFIYFQF